MAKYLVTGGCGFIGTNFLRKMVEKYPNDTYICLDALTYAGDLNNIKSLLNKPNFQFVEGDIRDKKLVYSLFEKEGIDYVINFAAESHVDRSIDGPSVFLDTNYIGTSVLLEACREFGIKRFHQVSTDEVYGDLPLVGKSLPFKEKSLLKPSSPYSASKAAADLLILAYHRTYRLPATISRCSNNYGPYQNQEKLIPKSILYAMDNVPIPVYGNGRNVRDWIYVEDHIDAIDRIVRYGKDGEIYNISGHCEKCNLEVVKIILTIMNKPESLFSFIEDRPGHDLRYALDSSKIEKELGWRPRHTFEEGIRSTIQWYTSRKWEEVLAGWSEI